MHNAAGGGISAQPDDQDDSCHAIVSDLEALIEHVQASMKLIEIGHRQGSTAGDQEIADHVTVLDDVTPRYALAPATRGSASPLQFLLT